jgi:signal recognition particle subunit SRP54
VMFASNGEKLEDFDVFHPDRMASRILGMGDMLTLIEQAEKTFDQAEAEKTARKLLAGGNEFTLEDFLAQMEQVRKLGSISKLLGMLPGMGDVKQQISQVDDKDMDRVAAIIKSMTPGERADVKIINGSRRSRIARGSGVTVTEVNNLIERFLEARKMMRQMGNGGMPGMPGLPGMGGGAGRRKSAKAKAASQADKKRNKVRSGNPARRDAIEQAKAAGAEESGKNQKPFELPDAFRDAL